MYDPKEIIMALKGCIIINNHITPEYGEVIRVERKRGFHDLYEVEYKYLDPKIKCTCQFDAAVYGGDIYKMFLIGGKGGHWVTDKKVEVIKQNKPLQLSLF